MVNIAYNVAQIQNSTVEENNISMCKHVYKRCQIGEQNKKMITNLPGNNWCLGHYVL